MRVGLLIAVTVVVLSCLGPGAARAQGRVGVMIDAGFPDGAGGALVVEPLARVRLHAGGSHNGISPGVRAGISVAAWRWLIAPTATIEVGHFFSGDARPLARMLSGDPELDSPLLEEVGYDFASALLGLEFGGGPVTLFVHAGATVVRGQVRGLETALMPADDSSVTLRLEDDPRVTAYAPSVRLGLILHF